MAAKDAPRERKKPGPKPREEALQMTSVRFRPEQWQWLREQAFKLALETGARPDASEVVRRLVDAAMKRAR